MKRGLNGVLAAAALAYCGLAAANRGDVDVVLPVSPEIWGTAKSGANSPQPCNRCCVYQNKNYSEGAVLKVEGEVLQCVREPNTIGTNPLIWVRLKK
ncbi:YnjH family protein [uncultured Serratia sp.]|uniref:YnjH family protein n=1 Tax=uncultured Serratia sp. TaxID=239175 RepID=UPI002584C3CE|nr:YnjH family protein [uncultured Serratia sp.]